MIAGVLSGTPSLPFPLPITSSVTGDILGPITEVEMFVGAGEGDGVINAGVSVGAQLMVMSPSYGSVVVTLTPRTVM